MREEGARERRPRSQQGCTEQQQGCTKQQQNCTHQSGTLLQQQRVAESAREAAREAARVRVHVPARARACLGVPVGRAGQWRRGAAQRKRARERVVHARRFFTAGSTSQ